MKKLKSKIMLDKYSCVLIQAEDGSDFQEYVDSDGKRIPSGQDVGVEITVNGEITFYMLDEIYYSSN